MRVLGIDPSLQSTGFGVIESDGSSLTPVAFGVIKPAAGLPLHLRLHEIGTEIGKIIRDYGPEEASVENPFFARNVKTALVLGQVRGAVLTAIAASPCRFSEYSALEIKKAVTGYGQADKAQVKLMVGALLGLEEDPIPLDASDALAAAICHINMLLGRVGPEGPEGP
jgi:crossover junction endodeoxyribonuclease RuvC